MMDGAFRNMMTEPTKIIPEHISQEVKSLLYPFIFLCSDILPHKGSDRHIKALKGQLQKPSTRSVAEYPAMAAVPK